ncbi:hypothetical protein NC652_037475 [Populus alba x Populus x berolinensis]|nr:hypothetical protein NC652_037475 [Populus alba x Populus x berolinensis]
MQALPVKTHGEKLKQIASRRVTPQPLYKCLAMALSDSCNLALKSPSWSKHHSLKGSEFTEVLQQREGKNTMESLLFVLQNQVPRPLHFS